MGTPTVYEWAGGAEAFRRLTEVFYDKVLEDVGQLAAGSNATETGLGTAMGLGRGAAVPAVGGEAGPGAPNV